MGWDVSKLMKRLKDKGLTVTEEVAAVVVEETFDWAAEEARNDSGIVSKIAGTLLPGLKGPALGIVDKIDGIDDPNR